MQMWHKRKNGTLIEFVIVTDPPEALYWMTYKLKIADIRLVTKVPNTDKTEIREISMTTLSPVKSAAHEHGI